MKTTMKGIGAIFVCTLCVLGSAANPKIHSKNEKVEVEALDLVLQTNSDSLSMLSLAADIASSNASLAKALDNAMEEVKNECDSKIESTNDALEKTNDALERTNELLQNFAANITALLDNVDTRLISLEEQSYCNFRGIINKNNQQGRTCTCVGMWQGDRCERPITFSPTTAPSSAPSKAPTMAGCPGLKTKYLGDVIAKEGKRRAFCNGAGATGGWELAFNLYAKADGARHWSSSFWTDASRTNSLSTNPLVRDVKMDAFYSHKSWTEIRIVHHYNNGNSVRGSATYTANNNAKGKSLSELFKGNSNVQITGGRTSSVGKLQNLLPKNDYRSQPLHGDIFIDYNQPLVVNKRGGWAADDNRCRLCTTLSNSNYPHTYAGIGGFHREGGWYANFEMAPISPYCNLRSGYGNGNVAKYVGGSYPYQRNCWGESQTASWVDTNIAVYLK